MTNKWLEFLSQAGATIHDGSVVRFASTEEDAQACLNSTIISDLSHLDLLAIEGDDAESFLQGQLTCDVSKVNEHSLQTGAYCTPKGRMVTSFRALKIDKTYCLLMEPGLFQSTQTTLGKYIVFSKAEIKNARNDFIILGLAGSEAANLLKEICPVPDTVNSVTQTDTITCARIAGSPSGSGTDINPRFILFCNQGSACSIWEKLTNNAVPVGKNAWHLLDILSGYGQIEETTVEQFLPHNLNYQNIDAVSFNKGCFTGQEVIARMHYRGKLKSRLFLADIETADSENEMPKPGSGLFIKEEGNFKRHGELVNIAIVEKSAEHYDCKMLALLPSSNPGETPVFLSNEGGSALPMKIMDLPYKTESQK